MLCSRLYGQGFWWCMSAAVEQKDSKSAPGAAAAVSVQTDSGEGGGNAAPALLGAGSSSGSGGDASNLVVLGVSEIGSAIRAIDLDISSQGVWQTRLSESESAEMKCAALIAALDAKSEASDAQFKELQTRLAAANAERKELQARLNALSTELKADLARVIEVADEARRRTSLILDPPHISFSTDMQWYGMMCCQYNWLQRMRGRNWQTQRIRINYATPNIKR